ncbi:probable restriction/modification enzyme [Natronomonas moolapensis 8.8.11]|uniref:site-specific DNA-methyltransferase (adenine-specific) n=1 Tax=Natronomonas moolapensis (strain DSM 18674 / CECT 7526 / JCM 14361 / 8.8.11) TaxID=268739 RepID=M1XZA5_NATM8|nr:DNA methyltransferase [Natronomonas moolapensis]CCQ35485.1 probable restriction/modification enzyme [Natronomonas moolapensis 8.8.11]
MPSSQITAEDVADWDSLGEIADCFEEKKNLKRREGLSDRDDELVLEIDDGQFMILIESEPNRSASDYQSRTNARRRTNFVATPDYQSFTFTTRKRSFDEHGAINFQQFSFDKDEIVSGGGKRFSKLEKINELEYGEPYKIYELYDTREVVDEFYEEFEDLRTDLIQDVSGIDDNRGDAKERFVQVQLDRLLFLYFIQEKGLLDLNQSYLDKIHQSAVGEGEDVYESWLKPLFFDALGEGKRREKLGNVPHLNGGLFSQSPIEEEFPEAKLGDSKQETNDLYRETLDFLDDWNWHVDERLDIVDEKRISPEVLGHIFEQSVNQKEMGAYYTPEEITSFMAWNTVHPYLLDSLNEEVGSSYEELDEVFGLDPEMDGSGDRAVADGGIAKTGTIDSIQTDHVETLYFDILKKISILDPAVGSGAFLLAVQEVLIDTYLSCIEHFRNIKSFKRTGRVQNELERIEERGNAILFAKYEIILNNLYGVDIDQGAVEICKLRLWLSTVADIENDPDEVEPLPNIDFNIRQGNSLMGYVSFLDDDDTESIQGTLEEWGAVENKVESKYGDVLEAIQAHKSASSGEVASQKRREAEELIQEYSKDFDENILQRFHEMGYEDMGLGDLQEFSPFHWVLEFAEVYSKGGFDVLIGNPPWDRLKPLRDDYFSKYDEVFRTRMPEDKDKKQEELLEREEISQGWEEYNERMEMRGEYYTHSPDYELQSPTVGGSKSTTENDLSALFFERVFKLAREESYVGQILPGVIFNGASAKDLRMNLLNETELQSLPVFTNRGIFDNIDNRFVFGIPIFKASGETNEIYGGYRDGDLSILNDMENGGIPISRKVLEQYSPEARIFPYVEEREEVEVLEKIFEHPPVSEPRDGAWHAHPYRELDRTNDRDRFVESENEGDYPVLGGSNIYQYAYTPDYIENLEPAKFWSVESKKDPDASAKQRIREKNYRKLKRGLYDAFDGSGSQKKFVNKMLRQHRGEELSEADVLLDCTEYRIVYRDIARANDERTMIASVIPKGVVCHNKLHTIRPYTIEPDNEDLSKKPLHDVYKRVFTDRELFVAVGLLNSIPFDFLMRTKIDSTVVMYKFKESQMPRLTKGDDWFEYIWTRSAQLNCYGDEFGEMRERLDGIEPATDEDERRKLQAEIDAGAFHAYGLDKKEVEYVLDDFHRVRNPRKMTESYFELVKEKYKELQSS